MLFFFVSSIDNIPQDCLFVCQKGVGMGSAMNKVLGPWEQNYPYSSFVLVTSVLQIHNKKKFYFTCFLSSSSCFYFHWCLPSGLRLRSDRPYRLGPKYLGHLIGFSVPRRMHIPRNKFSRCKRIYGLSSLFLVFQGMEKSLAHEFNVPNNDPSPDISARS